MKKIKNRLLNIQLPPNRSAFLWGPRKTGKTFWINTHLSDSPLIDLLKTDVSYFPRKRKSSFFEFNNW